jgi:hypothetical protein
MRNVALAAAASTFVVSLGLGLAGLGAAAVAEGQPMPFPDYHWCPGQYWDPGWGDNWDWGRCHDDNGYDGEPPNVGGPNNPYPGPGGTIGVGPW